MSPILPRFLPFFGEIVPGEDARFGAIMRGEAGKDYAILVPDMPLISCQWSAYSRKLVVGMQSLTDGYKNTQAMLAAKNSLALLMKELPFLYRTDLYLPAKAELWALRANVPELFSEGWYWTSTENSAGDGAYIQDFSGCGSTWSIKTNKHHVRFVRKIPLTRSSQ